MANIFITELYLRLTQMIDLSYHEKFDRAFDRAFGVRKGNIEFHMACDMPLDTTGVFLCKISIIL